METATLKQEKFIITKVVPYLRKKAKILRNIKRVISKSKSSKKNDPITYFDIKIQKDLTDLILKNFPEHGVEGEEGRSFINKKKFKWILDPIDGTKSFIIGMPTYSNLIGFAVEKQNKLGFAYFPELEKFYITSSNKSFVYENMKNKKKINCSNQNNLKKSKLVINSLNTIKSLKFLNYFKKYKYFFKITGADAYNYCRLAEGKIDIIIESNLKTFDIKPLIPIIRNSGGVITDWSGNINVQSGNVLVASNKNLHKKALKILKRLN
jgi:myo-inositol-1(or 4)-monophosphatase|tara:strand:+ start:207 stop:1004 length:798 start_codon:yes stop_codon:yes gene_type:complete